MARKPIKRISVSIKKLFTDIFFKVDVKVMDKITLWQAFSKDVGGTFSENLHEHIQVEVLSSFWTIIFDIHPSERTSGSTLTRVRAMFFSKDNFLFTIYKQDIFSEIAKFFGMQDIEVGNADFDKTFVIKSNNPKQIIALLENPTVCNILLKYPYAYFDIRKSESFFSQDLPEGVLELYLHVVGAVMDIEELKSFYLLFNETLKTLCLINSAYEKTLMLDI